MITQCYLVQIYTHENLGTFEGLGPLGKIASSDSAFVQFTTVFYWPCYIDSLCRHLVYNQIAGGAFRWLAREEKRFSAKAQKHITNAILACSSSSSLTRYQYCWKNIWVDILSPYKSLYGIPTGPMIQMGRERVHKDNMVLASGSFDITNPAVSPKVGTGSGLDILQLF